ncbi:Hypothetical predicted protein [Mytilus galloprovincialis]|uniref:ATP-dependent DNA helicase n=1 Tax=Mytilus galloprovincialis TaxID=29158 RepID=A0A8B6F4B2_MYTGA|nr:Hypothetical predicted protein [Mytilus galloprovincialis]
MTYDMFLDDVLQMNDENYIKAIRSKRKPSEVRVNGYMKTVLIAWQANHDLQFVLDAFACAVYIVSYISKSQKGMSALLDQAAKEARQGNLDLKHQTDSENFYRERLMLFYPWRNELSDLQCGHETFEKMYLTVSRLLEKKAKQYEGKVIDLEKAIEEAENDCNENDQIAPATQQVEMEDAEIGPTESEQYVISIQNDQQNIDCGAGCGKSVVVRTIFQALHRHLCSIEGEDPDDIRILLCAPTGKAAYNINGLTIHNAFQIQPNKGLDQSLSCDVLNTLRMKITEICL